MITIELQNILNQLKHSLPRKECITCECFQGFLVQLEMDFNITMSELTDSFQINETDIHKCLGCNPCPPANIYTEYLRNRKKDTSNNSTF